MSRGLLDDATAKSIEQQLPSIVDVQTAVQRLSPAFISMKFDQSSTVPTAAVCLQDAVNTLAEARYALFEALAHRIWYLEKSEPRKKEAAVFFTRYYADDIALRLYAAGEHLAEGIINMLEINKQDLAQHEKSRVSRQAIVGAYMQKQNPAHPITAAIVRLAESKEWQDAIKYRQEWVHAQPPLVKGLGIVYKRGQRWKLSTNGTSYELGLGGGDEPEYSVDELLRFLQAALFRFVETVTSVVQHYIEMLKAQGFEGI